MSRLFMAAIFGHTVLPGNEPTVELDVVSLRAKVCFTRNLRKNRSFLPTIRGSNGHVHGHPTCVAFSESLGIELNIYRAEVAPFKNHLVFNSLNPSSGS